MQVSSSSMQRHVDRNRPADSGRDGRDRDRDRGTDRGVVVPGRPGVGAVVQAVITSVKPQLGLFVELPLPSREFEGLVHLSEVICQFLVPLGSMSSHQVNCSTS